MDFVQLEEWGGAAPPECLGKLDAAELESVGLWARDVVAMKTDGFEELYQAIAMIVRYIPHFVVIPLMVDHIKPPIAAGVCRKMSIDQATGYANDLPPDYFTEVAMHIEAEMMAGILMKMKRSHAEKFIVAELRRHLARMLEIAEFFDQKMLDVVARHVTLPEHEDDLVRHPHRELIGRIRIMQER